MRENNKDLYSIGKEENWIEELYKNAKRYDGGFSISISDIYKKVDVDKAAKLYPNTDDFDNEFDYQLYEDVADEISELSECPDWFDYEGEFCFKTS